MQYILKESLTRIDLVDKREGKKYKECTTVPKTEQSYVPKIEQPYGKSTGHIRQMAPGRCFRVVGTGFQTLATKGPGTFEAIDSSAHRTQVSVLNLGRKGEKLKFFV